jgi:hypothetical protein
MAARSGAPPPAKAAEYDQEIKDMADYIHNYKIDSDLAVSYTTHDEMSGKLSKLVLSTV